MEKNFLDDLKKKVDTEMDEATINALVDDDKNNEKIQNLIMCEPGVENMQKVLKEKAKSLRKMCSVN